MVAVAGVGIRVLLEDEVGHAPGLEELWEQGLGRLAEDKEPGLVVQPGDGFREVVLAVEEELPPVGAALCAVDVVGVPREDGPEALWVEVQGGLECWRVVETQVCPEPCGRV
jgi:hypothetical protein